MEQDDPVITLESVLESFEGSVPTSSWYAFENSSEGKEVRQHNAAILWAKAVEIAASEQPRLSHFMAALNDREEQFGDTNIMMYQKWQ